MAERRMFAKTIIDSDAFLDMPVTSQNLYFHLSMRADDDGFLNNSKKILRMVNASTDDLKILLSKRFLIAFDSGVVVIKHWRIHNYIQNDRYKETVYREEKSQLSVKQNKVYTLDTNSIHDVTNSVTNRPEHEITYNDPKNTENDHFFTEQEDTQCIHPVSKMDSQVRLGKGSIGKNLYKENVRETFEDLDEPAPEIQHYHPCSHSDLWNSLGMVQFKMLRPNISTTDLEEIRKIAEGYTFAEIQLSIRNYAKVQTDQDEYRERFAYKGLMAFLKNGGIEEYSTIEQFKKSTPKHSEPRPAKKPINLPTCPLCHKTQSDTDYRMGLLYCNECREWSFEANDRVGHPNGNA